MVCMSGSGAEDLCVGAVRQEVKCFSRTFQQQGMPQNEIMLVWGPVCFPVVSACNEYLIICCEQFNVGRWTVLAVTWEAFSAWDLHV